MKFNFLLLDSLLISEEFVDSYNTPSKTLKENNEGGFICINPILKKCKQEYMGCI